MTLASVNANPLRFTIGMHGRRIAPHTHKSAPLDINEPPEPEDDGMVYFDVSDQIAEHRQGEKLGGPKLRDQISTWDVIGTKPIDTGGSGKLEKGALNGEAGCAGSGVAESFNGYGRRNQGLREGVVGQVRGCVSVGVAPGLVPVLKHRDDHDQSSNGRRGSGGVMPIPEDLQKIFDYAVGRVKPLNDSEKRQAEDILGKVIAVQVGPLP